MASSMPNNGLRNNGACQTRDDSTDFVRIGIDWQPTYVAWYLDGVNYGRFNGNASSRRRRGNPKSHSA